MTRNDKISGWFGFGYEFTGTVVDQFILHDDLMITLNHSSRTKDGSSQARHKLNAQLNTMHACPDTFKTTSTFSVVRKEA